VTLPDLPLAPLEARQGRIYPVDVGRRAALVVPYDPEWAHLFEAERSELEQVLRPWLDRGIHHVGSTAVPGLAAKPIIDIVAGVRDLDAARAAFGPLGEIGYRYHEHRPEAHAFFKPESAADWWEQTHHLHLTEPGSDLWRERLAFRDAPRAEPALAAEYQEWKLSHVVATAQPNAYTEGKRAFVAGVLAKKGITLKPDSERLTAAALAWRRG
jgi:GrpB-like predicted nucleotidyltransferase (UPF0157 family)